MSHVTYKENAGSGSFPNLIQTFGVQNPGNYLQLDAGTGQGYIRYIDIEAGLQLRLWDCTFDNGLTIFREGYEVEAPRTFTLVSYLTPQSFELKDCHNSPAVIVDPVWDTVLMSSDADFQASLLPGKAIQCISINFSMEWFQKNVLSNDYRHTNLIKRLSLVSDPFVIFESLSVIERKNAMNFFNEDNPRVFGKFFWRSKVLSMLTFFFSKTINRLSLRHGVDMHHEEQMAEVEKQLVDNLYNGLPDLKTLAKKLAISESTLKRYFRRIYGKNIYNYYLEKRMASAWRLLTEKNKSVSETASIMGYENISHFISVFKKQFGMLPGTLRKEIVHAGR